MNTVLTIFLAWTTLSWACFGIVKIFNLEEKIYQLETTQGGSDAWDESTYRFLCQLLRWRYVHYPILCRGLDDC